MFGEEQIIGRTVLKLDDKGRITLPKFTHAEPGDEVALMYDLRRTKIVIYAMMEFEKKLKEAEQKIEEMYHEKKMSYDEKIWFKRYIFGDGCLEPPSKIEKNRRLAIPSRAITKLNLKDEVFAVGNESRLEIYPTEESYTLSLNRQKNV